MRTELLGQDKNVVRIKLEIEASEFTKALNKTLTELSQQANIPGFRKGHIKRSVLEMRYGRANIYNEALDKIMPDQLRQIVNDYELDPIASPNFELDAAIEEGKDISGVIVFEVRPEVELPDVDSMEIEKVVNDVTEESIDSLAKRVRIQLADIKPTDRPIQDGDLVDIELTIRTINEDGTETTDQPKPEPSHEKINLADETIRAQVREALIGKSKGDEVSAVFDVELGHADRELAGKRVLYKMKVEDVSEYVLPEVNEEFYKNVFGENTDIKDNEAFRARLRRDLEAEVAETSRVDLVNRAVDMVVKASTVEIPEKLINQQAQATAQEDQQWAKDNNVNLTEAYALDTEDGRKGYTKLLQDRAEAAVKNVLVMDAAAKKYDVHVEQADLEAEFERRAEQLNVSKAFVAKFFYEHKDQLDRLVDELRWTKIADALISHMKVKEVSELSKPAPEPLDNTDSQSQPQPEAQPQENNN